MTMVSKDMKDIDRCVICGKTLEPGREHVDTCGEQCFKTLLKRQREGSEGVTYTADPNCGSRANHHHGVRCDDCGGVA